MNQEVIWELIRGSWRFAAVTTFVDLRCADHLKDGPLPVAELAARSGAHAPSLLRVLRVCATSGLIQSTGPDTYGLTETGTLLLDEPTSMRSAIVINSDPQMKYATDALTQTVRTGRSAFTERYGVLYDHLATRPDMAKIFNDFMNVRTLPLSEGVADRYDMSGIHTLVDVGAGKGHTLAAALRANPELRGVLFDRPHVVEHARQAFTEWGLADRTEFVGGDFFESVPAGHDAYLLGSVVHNWDDADAERILRQVREAMNSKGRVLLVELILPDDDSPHIGKELDMRMLGLFGQGRERTRSEFATLLEKAGLRLSGTIELPNSGSLIEALPQ